MFVCVLHMYPANPGWGLKCVSPGSSFGFYPANSGRAVGRCVFVCALRLYPAIPGSAVRCGCVCLGSGFGCAPQSLAGTLGCVRLCARSTCTPPIQARVSGWCVLVGVLVFCTVHPRVTAGVLEGSSSSFGFYCAHPGWGAGLCLFACALRLYTAIPGWGVRCAFASLGSGLSCAPPFLAEVLGCLCLCGRSTCTPPILTAVCGACGWGWFLALTPPILAEVFGCVGLCARSACTPPFLARVSGAGGCAWVRVLAAPRLSWLGCWGAGVWMRAPPAPRHSWLGLVVCGLVVARCPLLCRGSLCGVRATRGCAPGGRCCLPPVRVHWL